MQTKKVVFIAHPVGGDIAGNVKKVLAICERVHKDGHIPVAPYLVSLQYLNDAVTEDRDLGIEANLVCFRRRFIDELWLFGERISEGMKEEVMFAVKLKIPIVPKTEETARDLKKLFALV